MKKMAVCLGILALLLPMRAFAQAGGYVSPSTGGGVATTTVAGLASLTSTGVARVTNGSNATDCTVGGGTSVVLCLYNGTSWAAASGSGTGSVTSFSTGNLAPLFTGSVANPTTTPALSFSLSNAAANSWFGNPNGSLGAPSFNTSVIPNVLINWAAPSAIGSTTPAAGTFTSLNTANLTLTGLLTTAASAAGGAGFNLPPGSAPTAPNNGDLWTTTAGLFAQINGATVGPFGTSSITLQTNGSANGSNSLLNFVTSAMNSTGLTATPSNINTNQEKIEVGGTLNLASLTAPAAEGDTVCGNSTPVWADCVPGIAGRTVTIATDTIVAGDRLKSALYNSASAAAVTLSSAASLGNNFAFKTCNENTGTVTFTPGAGQINNSANLTLAEGQCASINSPDNVNYTASISNGSISTDTSLSVTRSPFGVQLGLSATSFPFSGGSAGSSFQDVVETAAPVNPAAGNCRLYVDSTSGFLAGLNSTGASCVSSGGSTAWSALGNPSGTLSLTMNANVSSFLYNATTGAGVNMWTETDTANNTGTGFLHRIGTAAGSAASAMSLFATGSATNTFGNPFAEVISNPTAATSSQAQSSPKSEICGRTWSGGTPADTPECFSWQVVPGGNTSNPTVSLNLVHESGTTGFQSINFPLANFLLSVNSISVGNTINNTTNNGVTTIQGGKDNNGASGNLVARGGAISGGSGAFAAGGGLFEGGNDASTSATSSAGGAELLAGAATGATQGLQGLLATVPVYVKGATVTQWNLETESAQMTVADAGASPGYWLCIAEVVGTNTVQCINDGETAVNASAAVTLGHTVCSGTTAGKVTDSGGMAACTLGTGVGVVMATSGTWKFPDGTSVTASTTLPIIQIVRD